MSQWIKVPAAKPDSLSSIPRAHGARQHMLRRHRQVYLRMPGLHSKFQATQGCLKTNKKTRTPYSGRRDSCRLFSDLHGTHKQKPKCLRKKESWERMSHLRATGGPSLFPAMVGKGRYHGQVSKAPAVNKVLQRNIWSLVHWRREVGSHTMHPNLCTRGWWQKGHT